MVVHFSSKLSHLAQSFRPGQHHIRSAFPSASGHQSTGSSTFFCPSNGPNAPPSNTYFSPSPLPGSAKDSHQPAGTGKNGQAGGAGGSRWSAGRAPKWGFQPRIANPTIAAQSDHNTRLADEEQDEPHLLRPRPLARPRSNSATKLHRPPHRPVLEAAKSELFLADEVQSTGARLASIDMQRRYRSAFVQGIRTPDLAEMEREADEMDLGTPVSNVRSSGRRASISKSMVSTPPVLGAAYRPAVPLRSAAPSPSRSVHNVATSTTDPFPSTTPPLADQPRRRRNSTSAVSTKPSLNYFGSRPYLSKGSGRPPTSAPQDYPQRQMDNRREHKNVAAQERHEAILQAQRTRSAKAVQEAVRRYLAVEADYSTESHNACIAALDRALLPTDPITPIVDIYNQLFDHPNLSPNPLSYNLVIQAFCGREVETVRQISYIEKRTYKRDLAAAARGPWDTQNDAFEATAPKITEADAAQLAKLRSQDFLKPALDIYEALGTNADRLRDTTMNRLLHAAVVRGRVDLALAIHGRIEASVYQSAGPPMYRVLIEMYGQEKDSAGVEAVFEGYLEARKSGLPASAMVRGHTILRRENTKHSATSEPIYGQVREAREGLSGDEEIWRCAIKAFFKCGDAAKAVSLIDRAEQELEASGKVPAGFPVAPLSRRTLVETLYGFCHMRDVESAQRWFERIPSVQEHELAHLVYLSGPASDRQSSVPLVNYFFRALQSIPDVQQDISLYVFVIDTNLAAAYSPATTPEQVEEYLDAVHEFWFMFRERIAAGRGRNIARDATLGTGVISRIAAAQATHGRAEVAARTFSELASAVHVALQETEGRRRPDQWVAVLQTSVAVLLGCRPGNWPSFSFADGATRTAIGPASSVLNDHNNAFLDIKATPLPLFEVAVVESYLAAKDAAKGDAAALGLSGAQWFTIVEAFASVEGQKKHPRGFPGFEPIIDDLASSGVTIPELDVRRHKYIADRLASSGMPGRRIAAVLSFLDKRITPEAINEQFDKLEAAKTSSASTDVPVAVTEPTVASPSVQSVPESVDSDAATTLSSALSSLPSSLPTPPSTPPSYFADLPAPTVPEVNHGEIDADTTSIVDDLLTRTCIDDAFIAVMQGAQQGRFAHPDAASRLIELLGRSGKANEAREVYLATYASLTVPSMETNSYKQSTSWVMLEDRMIIALAHVGLLTEVGIHRNRLLAAGSAPSADAYAAMILNMKETTNDAAVALDLFEESQRNNVAPNVYLFNTLISKLSRARRAGKAIEYFELMKEQNLRPSSITYGAIINACCKTGDDEAANYLFAEMANSPGFKPRVPPYNTMIQFYANTKPDRERALQYYDKLVKARVQPTGHTYKLLLDVYGSIGEPDVKSLKDVFNTILADPRVTVTGAHWAALIHSYGSIQKDLDNALKIFNSIATHRSVPQPRDLLPDAVVYESLFNAFVANERPDLCDEYLIDMRQRGVRMTAYVANTLIRGYSVQGKMDSAREVFESLGDAPPGVAAAGNHSVDRHPQHRQNAPLPGGDIVYREPSTWEAMILAEIAAKEIGRASVLMTRLEQRAFPEAVVARIRRHMEDVGAETLPSA